MDIDVHKSKFNDQTKLLDDEKDDSELFYSKSKRFIFCSFQQPKSSAFIWTSLVLTVVFLFVWYGNNVQDFAIKAKVLYAAIDKVTVAITESPSNETEPEKTTTYRSSSKSEIPEELNWYLVPSTAPKDDRWVVEVLAAFYDYRYKKILVLLASAASELLYNKTPAKFTFHCAMFYEGSDIVSTSEGEFYTSYMLYCPLPLNKRLGPKSSKSNQLIPSALTLIRNDSLSQFESANWTVPIIDLGDRMDSRFNNGQDTAKTLALCVGIMFGSQPWLTILQYIEFHRWQGVEKFLFFYSEMSNSSEEIFDWYQKFEPGLIQLIKWMPMHSTCDPDYRCQLLRDNYCSYSLMHKYKFVANSDYDELFFPTHINKENLTELLAKMDRPDRGSFTFRAKYHQLLANDTPPWEALKRHNVVNIVREFLPLFHHRNVSVPAGHFYSPKTITKPETVQKRWIHFVGVHVKGTGIYHPEESEANLRHFKVRTWWGGWAENADQEVTYKMKDPHKEIGDLTLSTVTKRVIRVVKACKAHVAARL